MQTATELADRLGGHAEAFCRAYLPNGRRSGNYWQVGDVSGAEGASLNVRLHDAHGRKAGKWQDFASGEFGDLLDIIAHVTHASGFADIANEARHFLGQPELCRAQPPPALTDKAETTIDGSQRARRLFSLAVPIRNTPAERYLRRREIFRHGRALAWHDGVYYRDPGSKAMRPEPAMLAAITDNAGIITGVARTWLDVNRMSVADLRQPRRVIGRLHGNAVRFGRRDTILAIGEGIETMLSVRMVLPFISIAACLSATHLGQFEVPGHVGEVWIFADHDDAGRHGAARLAERVRESGRKAVIHEAAHDDFNTTLCRDGPHGILNRMEAEIGPEVLAFAGP